MEKPKVGVGSPTPVALYLLSLTTRVTTILGDEGEEEGIERMATNNMFIGELLGSLPFSLGSGEAVINPRG